MPPAGEDSGGETELDWEEDIRHHITYKPTTHDHDHNIRFHVQTGVKTSPSRPRPSGVTFLELHLHNGMKGPPKKTGE